ncbi:MAG TPA: hypothetical protein ENK85_08760 [Saprospiraceae bacterium]|nr:hypothetical protein [Saprospiraceae bacterium]
MQIQIYSIPTFANQALLDEMNAFLRGHQIIDVKQQLVTDEGSAYWSIFIRYVEGGKPNVMAKNSKKSSIDYREVLDKETFKIFSKLRSLRKELAEENGVPLYAVLNNKELAAIASLSEMTLDNVKKIEGIGQKKMEKYVAVLLQRYADSQA